MSRLRRTSFPSSGAPESFPKLSWDDFVQLVLELTVKAYEAMYQARIARSDWEENVFSLCLGEDYLQPLAFDHAIFVILRPKIHTEQMKQGKQATIEAKEIDLMLFGSWEREYHEKHFVWEAKRVGDKRVNGKFNNLNSEYVNEAIYRFVRREYADGLRDAGVLGYVLAGDIANIVSDINASMGNIRKNPPLPESNRLRPAKPIHNFEHIYQSQHTRTDNTNINFLFSAPCSREKIGV